MTAQISDHTGSYTIPIYLITGLLGLSVIAARPHGLRGGQTPAGLPAVPDPLVPDQG